MKYFDQYKALIDAKEIPVCHEMKLAIKRIERYQKQYIFKQEKVDNRIKFIEEECSNTKGLNSPLTLALPQKVWLETAFGFYKNAEVTKTNPDTMEPYKATEERRLIHEIPIIVSRASGKTTLAAAIALMAQIIDGEYGADVQCLAKTREQAGYLFNASRAMVHREGSLLNLLNKSEKLTSTKAGLMYHDTNSLVCIKTLDYDTLDGTNSHFNIFDEVHAYDEDPIKVVNDGSSKKRKNWQTWYISTNGTKREKVFDRYYKIWLSVLNGEIANDSIMPFIYKLDDVEEIYKPEMWMKAIPLLGITTEPETIANDIEMSKDNPVDQAELKSKTFNLPVNSYLAYFTNEECSGNKKEWNPEIFEGTDEKRARCVVGADLSDVNDICAISFMVVDRDRRYFMTRKYVPRSKVELLPKDQKDKYIEWESKGLLTFHDREYNDREFIFDDLIMFMDEHKIFPVRIGYDRWGAREFIKLWEERYGTEIGYEVMQTVKGLSNGLKLYKTKMKGGNIIFNDELTGWMHGNVNVKTDANNNVFPNRQQAKAKIDGFAAQLDAFITYENNKEELQFYFD